MPDGEVHKIYLGNIKGPPGNSAIATSNRVGSVKPDNESIIVTEDGTITSILPTTLEFVVKDDGHLYIRYDDPRLD